MLTNQAKRVLLNRRALYAHPKHFDLQSLIKNTPAASSAAIIQQASLMAPSAGYFTLARQASTNATNMMPLKSTVNFGGPNPAAFFSSAASDFSDSEDDSDFDTDSELEERKKRSLQRGQANHGERGSKSYSMSRGGSGGRFDMYKNFEPQQVFDEIREALDTGSVANFSDAQIQVMIQRAIRAHHRENQSSFRNRETLESLLQVISDQMNNGPSYASNSTSDSQEQQEAPAAEETEENSGVESASTATSSDPIPCYFHDLVSLLKTTRMAKIRNSVRLPLQSKINQMIMKEYNASKSESGDVDPIFSDSHATQILNMIDILEMRESQASAKLYQMITDRIKDEREPKPAQILIRVLSNLSKDPSVLLRNRGIVKEINHLLLDEDRFDITGEDVEIQTSLLLNLAKCIQNDFQVNRLQSDVCQKLLAEIDENCSNLQEKGVLLALKATETILCSDSVATTKMQALKLQEKVINLVLDLANQNIQLVHPRFLFDFSNAVLESSSLLQTRKKQKVISNLRQLYEQKLGGDDTSAALFVENSWDLDRFCEIQGATQNRKLQNVIIKTIQSPKIRRVGLETFSYIGNVIFKSQDFSMEEKQQIATTFVQNNRKVQESQNEMTQIIERLIGLKGLLSQQPELLEELTSQYMARLDELIEESAISPRDIQILLQRLGKKANVIDPELAQRLDAIAERSIPMVTKSLYSAKKTIFETMKCQNAFADVIRNACLDKIKQVNVEMNRKKAQKLGNDVEEEESADSVAEKMDQWNFQQFAMHGINQYFVLQQEKDPQAEPFALKLLQNMKTLCGKPTDVTLQLKMRQFAMAICTVLQSGTGTSIEKKIRLEARSMVENSYENQTTNYPDLNYQVKVAYQREQKAFGYPTTHVMARITEFMSSKEACEKDPNLYLQMIDLLSFRFLNKDQRDIFREIVESEDFDRTKYTKSKDNRGVTSEFKDFLLNDLILHASEVDDYQSSIISQEQQIERFGQILQEDSFLKRYQNLKQLGNLRSQYLQENKQAFRTLLQECLIQVDEKEIKKLRTDRFKALVGDGSFSYKNTKINNLRSIALSIARENLKEEIESETGLRNIDFLFLLNEFATGNWKDLAIYNSFIKGFGARFDQMQVTEQVRFCLHLTKAKLNQKDIFQAVMNNVIQECDKKGKNQMNHRAFINMLYCCLMLDMTDIQQFEQLLDPAYQNRTFIKNSFQNAFLEESTQEINNQFTEIALGLISRLNLNENQNANVFARKVINYLNRFRPQGKKAYTPSNLKLLEEIVLNEEARKSIFGDDTAEGMPTIEFDRFKEIQPERPALFYNEITKAFNNVGIENFQADPTYNSGLPFAFSVEQEGETKKFIGTRSLFMTLIDGKTMTAAAAARLQLLQILHPDAQILDQDEFKLHDSNDQTISELMVNKYGLKNLGAVPTMEKAEQEGAKLEENEEETNSSQN